MSKETNRPTNESIAEGILILTSAKSKKRLCCVSTDSIIELAKELEAAAETVRAKYKEIEF